MAALHNDGAAAPGRVTPTSETAREQAGRIEGQARADTRDSRSAARWKSKVAVAAFEALWGEYDAAHTQEARSTHYGRLADVYHDAYGSEGEFELQDELRRRENAQAANAAHRLLTKGECLARYAERNPKGFAQFDGWEFEPGTRDDVMHPDKDGFAVTGGGTTELMHGASVRVLVADGVAPDVAVALLRRIVKWIERDSDALAKLTPQPARVDDEVPF